MPAPGDAHVCARCHEDGGGCCRAVPLDTEYLFGLTQGEIALMAQASGLRPDQFVVADRASSRFLAFVETLQPLLLRTMPRGRRLRLSLTQSGDCYFLGRQGCRLPRPARPLYCRIYPFMVNGYGRLTTLESEHCLAQAGTRSYRGVLKRLGQDETTLRGLFAQLAELAAAHQAAPPLRLSSQA